jgi:hypothetical protein
MRKKADVATSERGAAALLSVMGVALVLTTSTALVIRDGFQHDPMVLKSQMRSAATSALNGAIVAYEKAVTKNPTLLVCNSTTTPPTCSLNNSTNIYDHWQLISQPSTRAIGEYYLFTNPQICFVISSSTPGCTAQLNAKALRSVSETVLSASGWSGNYLYERSTITFSPKSPLSSLVWWQNYSATDPQLEGGSSSSCTYDYANTYKGPTLKGSPTSICHRIAFSTPDHLDGSVFSNDSIYVTGFPLFGSTSVPTSLSSADPKCLFVGASGAKATPSGCSTLSSGIIHTGANSISGAGHQKIPQINSALATEASVSGCRYVGPTTISFFSTTVTRNRFMNVSSPETQVVNGQDTDNAPSNHSVCIGSGVSVPKGGVLYIANSSVGTHGAGSCTGDGANPFDGIRQKKSATAQIVTPKEFDGTTHGYNFTSDISTLNPDCEGDAFVRDAALHTRAPSTGTCSTCVGGVGGAVTVVAQNNVVIDGTLRYADCGTSFTSKNICPLNSSSAGANDVLALVAQGFVEVSRGGKPSCVSSGGIAGLPLVTHCSKTPSGLLATCLSTATDLQAALCSPGPTLVIDAEIFAVTHGFVVNNGAVGTQSTGTVVIFGLVAQNWRGLLGVTVTASGVVRERTGYAKNVHGDPRAPLLVPAGRPIVGVGSWLVSASVATNSPCGGWPAPSQSGGGALGGFSPSGVGC